MKFSVAAVAAFAAFAAAANTSLTPEQQCASQCPEKDICCKAICFKVPCPSNQDAKDTTSCAAKCPTDQGPVAYAKCQQGCIQSHFYTPGATPTAAPTGSSSGESTATTTGSSPSNTSGSETSHSGSSGSSPSATHSGSGSTPTHSGAAVSNAKVQLGSAAGAVGLLVAAFAL
ncbi:cell wall serine-threonine-rich galactomannoprotein Mp1 [Trichophyton verrucosum HKI 0517]|uniref:Cell wall serine-threonine-rich galactomannoprotein Mp1 n=1 Tax=Trichophyton verrucosum (strain HKI 0517) TaxID=663202 RepID=D4DDU0_TRIVH|nr:cell wall serine-threonine-rich galactomannoprotein Mp1 [Trichophyton verrucosum HKI 0517]EFE39982.1 cell wall serine-threonine-rich galactomannoprotein Mp1 [Trichophyton verrucosum HKI 0517]